METITDLGCRNEELGRRTVLTTHTKRLDCWKYWNAHGVLHDWGTDIIKFPELRELNVVEVSMRMHFSMLPSYDYTRLELYANGERIKDLGEVTEVKILKTKVKLQSCIGSG